MNTSHTPTPWKVKAGKSDESTFNIFDAEGNFIPRTDAEHSQMAAFVQRAVNSHEALVAALSRAVSQLKFLQSQHADAWAEDEEKEVMDTFEEGKKALSLANS